MTEDEKIPTFALNWPDDRAEPDGKPPALVVEQSLASLRMDLIEFRRTLKDAVDLIDQRIKDPSIKFSASVWVAAGEVALGLQVSLLLEADDERIKPAIDAWRRRIKLPTAVRAEIVLLGRIVDSAISSSRLLDAIDADVVPGWGNLPPALLARAINGYVHAMVQRLPAWEDS